ncbi:hypothetical protein ACS0TY_031911 [Phlomoides rotata]
MGESPDPPLETTYKNLLDKNLAEAPPAVVAEECELPLIDMKQLWVGDREEREACKKLIAGASQEWGFFQVINHGISGEVIDRMRAEQVKLFKKPFHDKKTNKDLNFSAGSYRWGTPSATCLKQLSWSEAFHVQLTDILPSPALDTLRSSMEQFASKVSEVAQQLADILAEEMMSEYERGFFREKCLPYSCYLRLNRYPVCPILYNQMMGIMPHTDSDFLTVLHQDNVGGLQLVKDGSWVAVKPNPHALVINIGDLFQAWSNNVYKSVEHRVVANAVKERFSIAYFFCPSLDTVIKSQSSGVYRSFSFGEYKKQVQEDVQIFGYKVEDPEGSIRFQTYEGLQE